MQLSLKYLVSFFVLIFLISINSSGCRTSEVSKEQVKMEKATNKEQEAYQKEYEDAVKNHRKMQSDRTKEMMKQSKTQQKQYNKAQQRSFWDRLFRKKCSTEYGNG